MSKIIAVVGEKHSGKTTIIEQMIKQLKQRKHHVGTIKEMVRIPTLDTPATETDRYTNAGSEITVAVPRNETVIFIKKRLTTKEILPYLKGLDYVLLEGFEEEKTVPKIIAAKTAEEVKEFLDGTVIAISGLITESEDERKKAEAFGLPLLNTITDSDKLADLIEDL